MQGNSFNFLDDDPEAVDCIVQYFYTFDYKHRPRAPDDAAEAGTALQEQSGPPAETPASDASVMVLHVKVYALAEKYSITPLKALALEKFRVAALDHWDTDSFLVATREAYASTISEDKGMRNAVLKTLHENSRLLDRESVQELLRRVEFLAFDLLMYSRQLSRHGAFGFGRSF